ncbi:hypothetical protein [Pontixanthobacter aquaemixtae]|uniref:Lipoprotein n=1 Tax=Pontixanthobacter aquaemixtae TaxID=1958940 RepID=A0A844ZPD0_9SPHN|nr:hypothetical protein [Pontixanthobacter aquaemixtae]MXO89598.1 hypothetical protein [Pontixanthobacter aquaemixtae]
MYRTTALTLGLIGLASCSASGEDAQVDGNSGDALSGAAAVTVESLAATRSQPVDDQFITCTEKQDNGITSTQFFLITDGAVKSYSRMQNFARDMCDPGQPGCGLGWQGEKVGLYFETASGAVNQMLLDIETLTMEKRLTSDTSGVEEFTFQCESGPFPEGVTID